MGPRRSCGLRRRCFLGEGGLKEMVGLGEKRRCFSRKGGFKEMMGPKEMFPWEKVG